MPKMVSVDKEIDNFLKAVSDLWKDEALDCDETEEIASRVLIGLNRVNGNEDHSLASIKRAACEDS